MSGDVHSGSNATTMQVTLSFEPRSRALPTRCSAQARNVDLVRLLDGEYGGCAHAAAGRLVAAGMDDGLVRFVQGPLHCLTGVFLCREPILHDPGNNFGGQAAGLLAFVLTPHAVG